MRDNTTGRKMEDSLRKRYGYKLITNFLGMGIGLLTAGIVPRTLGPELYGNYNFLNNFFSQLIGFFDLGTSAAFYTKLSQRKDTDPWLVPYYFFFVGLVSLIIILFLFVGFVKQLREIIWPGQAMVFIFLAGGLGLLNWVGQVFNYMTDAYGLTAPAEITKVIQKICLASLIVVLMFYSKLNLMSYFCLQSVIMIILIFTFNRIIKTRRGNYWQGWATLTSKIKDYTLEFFHYSHPLCFYALIATGSLMFDRWLLQIYGGSTQQGYFSLSYTMGAYCFIFTNAMTPLLLREFSIAVNSQDLTRMAPLFRKYVPALYAITAYLSCFVALQAGKIVYIFGGHKYVNAAMVTTILAFYPIHQTYGQLISAALLAAGQTRLYRNIGIISAIIGVPITYFVLAPLSAGGLASGAIGVAIKLVLLQFISVNAELFFIAKNIRISFGRYFTHQALCLMFLLGVGYSVVYFTDHLLNVANIIISFMISGIIYSIITFGASYYIPAIFGLKRGDISIIINILKNKLNLYKSFNDAMAYQ